MSSDRQGWFSVGDWRMVSIKLGGLETAGGESRESAACDALRDGPLGRPPALGSVMNLGRAHL